MRWCKMPTPYSLSPRPDGDSGRNVMSIVFLIEADSTAHLPHRLLPARRGSGTRIGPHPKRKKKKERGPPPLMLRRPRPRLPFPPRSPFRNVCTHCFTILLPR